MFFLYNDHDRIKSMMKTFLMKTSSRRQNVRYYLYFGLIDLLEPIFIIFFHKTLFHKKRWFIHYFTLKLIFSIILKSLWLCFDFVFFYFMLADTARTCMFNSADYLISGTNGEYFHYHFYTAYVNWTYYLEIVTVFVLT